MTGLSFVSRRLRAINSPAALARAHQALDESAQRNAAAKRRRPMVDSVSEERAAELQAGWRDATALWIARHPKGEDAALLELNRVFPDERGAR